jgi:hypothetical protein
MSGSSFKPSVPRHWLFAMASLFWLTAGGILCTRASIWLANDSTRTAILLEVSGIVAGLVFYILLFIKVARKNIVRICSLPDRPCFFAFTAWKGYLMIGGMMTLGIMLRNSSLPREILIVPYLAMGGALILASFRFAVMFWNTAIRKYPCSPGE